MFATVFFPSKQNSRLITRNFDTNMAILFIHFIVNARQNHNACAQFWSLLESPLAAGPWATHCHFSKHRKDGDVWWLTTPKMKETTRQGQPFSSWEMSGKKIPMGQAWKAIGWSSESLLTGFIKARLPYMAWAKTVLPLTCMVEKACAQESNRCVKIGCATWMLEWAWWH